MVVAHFTFTLYHFIIRCTCIADTNERLPGYANSNALKIPVMWLESTATAARAKQ